MKIIICGAGQVGWQIARHLSGERNDVTVIDLNADLVRKATEMLDVQGVAGFASHPDVLDRAGANDADLIIAATHSDEVNMVTCQIAHSVFQVPRKIGRLRSAAYLEAIYSDLYTTDHLPIDVVISPEREVAAAVISRLESPSTFDAEDFMGGRARLLGIDLADDCPALNTPLRQLTDLFPTLRARIVALRRAGRLAVARAGDELNAGDQVYLFCHHEDAARALEIFGKPGQPVRRVVLIGGGNIGQVVAEQLDRGPARIDARIIERDRARAEAAADALSRTIVLHGDGLSPEMLAEAEIDRADAVVTLTDDDKTNILAALRARQNGARMVISLINDPSLVPLIQPMEIDAYINPRATTVSTILRHIRHGRVRDVYAIGDAEAEVIEAQVLATSSVAGKTLREIAFPAGAMVGMVMKRDHVVPPHGDLRLEEGDVICIFSLSRDVPRVEELLQVAINYF
ncbi:MAG: Trk system potassium transporter TrkA [Paracoccus sp. (in: a-proteobacteria)]|nr:Trk system potassium transporter TrkA [Paracoccus sp. (in: a-proteobacteria)]